MTDTSFKKNQTRIVRIRSKDIDKEKCAFWNVNKYFQKLMGKIHQI